MKIKIGIHLEFNTSFINKIISVPNEIIKSGNTKIHCYK